MLLSVRVLLPVSVVFRRSVLSVLASVRELFFSDFRLEPMEVSPAGTSVAPAGMELSYSRSSRSIALRTFWLIVMPRVFASVVRILLISGIQ